MTAQPYDDPTVSMDDIRVAWRERGLGEGADSFLAAASVLRFQRVMTQVIEAELRPLRMNLTDYLLLVTLELDDRGTRLISQLARALVVHATTVTLATDRLEERGLLARTPHPTDRRATEVRISDEGRELLLRATAALDSVGFGMAGSTEDDKRTLIDLVTQMRAVAGDRTPPTSG